MIFLKEIQSIIKNPSDDLSLEVKNYLYENLKNGLVFITIPVDFNQSSKDLKKHKKNYKVGFIYDMLGVIYPEMGKEKKHEVISEQFQMWFTYRQFKTIIDEYEKDRSKYLLKRNLL